MPEFEKPIEVINRKPTPGFQWTKAVEALCLYVVGHALHCAAGASPDGYQFSGERGSPAGTLDQALGKDNRSGWMMDMFGIREGEGSEHTNLYALIHRVNPDKKRKNSPFLLYPDLTKYPPLSVELFFDDRPVSSVPEIQSLLRALWKQWDGIPNITPSPVELHEPGELIHQGPAMDTSTSSGPVAPPAESIQSPSTNTQSPINQIERGQALPNLLKSMTVPSIKGYIVAGLSPERGNAAVEEALNGILSPASVNALAERLVRGSVEDFEDFYAGDYDSPPRIKHAVAAVIAANTELRTELAAKVVRSGYQNLVSWFQMFSFFCPHEVANQVEGAFLEFAKEPAFEEQYGWRWSYELTSLNLISHFSKFGCAGAVDLLKELCFEVISGRIKQGDPMAREETERFASLVGQKAFQQGLKARTGKRATP